MISKHTVLLWGVLLVSGSFLIAVLFDTPLVMGGMWWALAMLLAICLTNRPK